MKTGIKILVPAALLGVAAWLSGCDDLGVTAPNDGLIVLTAQPQTFNLNPLDPTVPRDTGDEMLQEVQLTARVFDASGRPLEGVPVLFDATAGSFQRIAGDKNGDGLIERQNLSLGEVTLAPTQVSTGVDGRAATTLLVNEEASDLESLTARAVASALEATVEIGWTSDEPTGDVNRPPRAVIIPVPINQAVIFTPVTFDGSSSTDDDSGDSIVDRRWRLLGTNPSGITVTDESVSGVLSVQRIFEEEQNLQVTLTVTDSRGASDVTILEYRIVCNTPPTALIAGGDQREASGGAGQIIFVQFDGRQSTDAETPNNLSFNWECPGTAFNAPPRVDFPARGFAQCQYLVEADPKVLPVTLKVTDQGGPGSPPRFDCALTAEDGTSLCVREIGDTCPF